MPLPHVGCVKSIGFDCPSPIITQAIRGMTYCPIFLRMMGMGTGNHKDWPKDALVIRSIGPATEDCLKGLMNVRTKARGSGPEL